MSPKPHQATATQPLAWVVFADEVSVPWLWLLRRDFRHCFILIEADAGWILYNPLSHCTELAWLSPAQALAVLQAHPAAVLVRVCRAPAVALPWRPFTCVEAIKRALGLGHACRALTPWRFHRFLLRRKLAIDFYPKIG
jgi:hypothetical protein